jgi:DNA-binding NtrC family response regulator
MARVLVIDDDKPVALMLFGLLEDAGHTPILARCHGSVFDDLDRCDYDVVLTDLKMPLVSGWDVADWLKGHRPGIPVVAVSGILVKVRNSDDYKRFAAVVSKDIDAHRIGVVIDEVAKLLAPRVILS